ncbi:MAG TPA: hemerythrin domain-containing protein [Rhodocyclaceae bacterium]|nr:hemerythrin domain-containing protein [Rhodocyclaceae bacterium]
MRPEAIQIIKDEHFAVAAVLYSLRYLVRQMRDGEIPPDFVLLRAIFDYIVSYPDRWHHPKEDKFLFAAVKKRSREGDAIIAELLQEHENGHPLIEELKTLLIKFQQGDGAARTGFYEAAERYVEMEWQHMRKEEDQLMPIAERVLTPEDWDDIYRAFQENDNPLFGIKPKEEAELLYQRILQLAPAPIGYKS